MATNPEKSEIAVLFSESVIDGITVKPWTIRQVIKLTPLLGSVLQALKERGIDLTKFDQEGESILEKDITLEEILEIVSSLAVHVPFVLSVTLDKPVEEAENIEWGKALALTANIIANNWIHIKNYWSLVMGQTGALKQAMIPEPTPDISQG